MPQEIKRPELARFLPPDLVVDAKKRLVNALSEAAQNPDLSLLGLLNIFVAGELSFRDGVVPIGETEATRLDQLARDLREQMTEASQNFSVLATQVDNQDLLTARDKFRQETAALKQRLDEAEKVGGRTRDVVNALIKDSKSGKVILGSVAGLERKGADLPAIVAWAFLRSLFEPEEGTTIEITAAAVPDFVTASRQAVVTSASRRAELPPPGQTETVVKIPRVQRIKTPPGKARLGVKSLLEAEGIDTTRLNPIDLAHIAKALPGATRKIFNVEPTPKNMRETLLAIVREEAGPDQFGEAASLRKVYGLGGQTSGTPPTIISEVMVPKGTKPPDKPDTPIFVAEEVKTRRILVREDSPLAAVFNFKEDGRWASKNWGLIAHQVTGTPRARDEAGKEVRNRQKRRVQTGLEDQINKLLVRCRRHGIETVDQLLETDSIEVPRDMQLFLKDLITPTKAQQTGVLGISVLAQIPDAIKIPDGVPTKPRSRDDLLNFLRRQKK